MDNKYKFTTTTRLGTLGLACLLILCSLTLRAATDPECPENPNLVHNGFYSAGATWPWTLQIQGDATGVLSSPQLFVGQLATTAISDPAKGSEVRARQIFGATGAKTVGLVSGRTYEVSFEAKANIADTPFEASVERNYGDYQIVGDFFAGHGKFTAGTDWAPYSYEFTPVDDEADDKAFRFEFWMGETVAELQFKSVSLVDITPCVFPTAASIEECPAEELFIGQPLNLAVSFEPENTDVTSITWTTGDNTVVDVEEGELVVVGAGTTTITGTTENDLTVTCDVTVGTEEVVECTHPNILSNSAFDDGTEPWEFYNKPESGAIGTLTVEETAGMTGNALKAAVTALGEKESDQQLKYNLSSMTKGIEYTLTFKAKADDNRDIVAKVLLNQPPWSNFLSEDLALTTTVQDFSFDLTYSGPDGAPTAVDFFLGQEVQSIWLDEVTLTATSGDCFEVSKVEVLDCPEEGIDLLGTAQLGVKVSPDFATYQSTSWSSADETVATINADGLVTALSAGTVDIVATSTFYSDVKGTCSITVNPVPVESITVSGCSSETHEVGDKVMLSYAVKPDDAGDLTAAWSTSDAAIATVSADGEVTFLSDGTVTITATSTQDAKTATCEMTAEASETILSVTGSGIKGLLLYPNPLNGNQSLSILSEANSPIAVTIMEFNGKVLSNKRFEDAKNVIIPRSSFGKAGLYLVRVENSFGSTVSKVQID